MVSRGMMIRQNRITRLTNTTMLNGLVTTFKIRFFSRFFVSGFLGRAFFDTITPLSDYCRIADRGNSPSSLTSSFRFAFPICRGDCDSLKFANVCAPSTTIIKFFQGFVNSYFCYFVHKIFMDFNNFHIKSISDTYAFYAHF